MVTTPCKLRVQQVLQELLVALVCCAFAYVSFAAPFSMNFESFDFLLHFV